MKLKGFETTIAGQQLNIKMRLRPLKVPLVDSCFTRLFLNIF